jgi:Lrp/AsnC family transcriptional regulator
MLAKGELMHANHPADLDPLDLQILRVLQTDASLSLESISERVGLSHSPCWRRIKRLEQIKVIRGRVALLDQDAIDLGITVVTLVKLASHAQDLLRLFESEASGHPQIIECYSILGHSDYLLKIVAANLGEYESFLKQQLLRLPYVETAKSMVVLKRIKATTALPI